MLKNKNEYIVSQGAQTKIGDMKINISKFIKDLIHKDDEPEHKGVVPRVDYKNVGINHDK